MLSFKQYLEEKGPCWKGYRQIGTKKKNGKEVPNCVPEEVEIEEANLNDIIWSKNVVKPGSKRELTKKHKLGDKVKYGGGISTVVKHDDKGFVTLSNPKWSKNKTVPHTSVKKINESDLEEGSESWEAGYKRRVVKTTDPEHKEKGYNWRIKGKDKANLTIKIYKEKPSQEEFNKQMKRVAGHEFGG